MIIAMAGLPGTGKTTLARELAVELPAYILNKDTLRAALFTPEEVEYSSRQDDFVVGLMFEIADYRITTGLSRHIILDGRTFSKKAQVDFLTAYAREKHWNLQVIYCTCSDELVRARLEKDVSSGGHPAADRDFDLYRRIKKEEEKIQIPHLYVNTGKPLADCKRLCLQYLLEKSQINKDNEENK